MVVHGGILWVSNVASDALTELSALTGQLLRTVHAPADALAWPTGLAVGGGDLYVANARGNSVTVLDATSGALVQVLEGPADGFVGPDAILVTGQAASDVWVANGAGQSLTRLRF